jgi:general stress protein 26
MIAQSPNVSLNDDLYHPAYEKIWEIMKSCRFGMLTTVDSNGSLHSRPMTTVQKGFAGTIWFFAPTDSDAARTVKENEQACVAYANTDKADFVCLSGTASIVMEKSIKEKLWNPMVQAWFPLGPLASDVALIKMDAHHAEYWDSESNKLLQLYSMAAAYVTGTRPKGLGEHQSIKL